MCYWIVDAIIISKTPVGRFFGEFEYLVWLESSFQALSNDTWF